MGAESLLELTGLTALTALNLPSYLIQALRTGDPNGYGPYGILPLTCGTTKCSSRNSSNLLVRRLRQDVGPDCWECTDYLNIATGPLLGHDFTVSISAIIKNQGRGNWQISARAGAPLETQRDVTINQSCGTVVEDGEVEMVVQPVLLNLTLDLAGGITLVADNPIIAEVPLKPERL